MLALVTNMEVQIWNGKNKVAELEEQLSTMQANMNMLLQHLHLSTSTPPPGPES